MIYENRREHQAFPSLLKRIIDTGTSSASRLRSLNFSSKTPIVQQTKLLHAKLIHSFIRLFGLHYFHLIILPPMLTYCHSMLMTDRFIHIRLHAYSHRVLL